MNRIRRNRKYLSGIVFVLALLNCNHRQSNDENNVNAGHSYYFNVAGNDADEGSKERPWQTISKLNSIQLKPGDKVFFESGQEFKGNILLDSADAGTKKDPVIIASTGAGKAVINGGDSVAMNVFNTKFINIRQLGFKGAGRKTGNTTDGLALWKADNITIDSVDIKGFQKSGLQITSSKDVEVTRVYAFENGFAGINVSGEWGKRDCSNIHISYCTAENNPGDPTNLTNHSGNGILVGICKNILIEYCVATNNGWDMPRRGNGPVGIWCYEADSIIIQHCISYKNKTAAGAADGGGFDLDGGITNSIIQYCLSYDNQGSGFGIFQYDGASIWNNNTIRYCISENDGNVSPAHAGVFIWNSSGDTNQFKNCYFYNNVVYNANGAAISYEAQSINAGFRFYNNIFVARDILVTGKETNSVYLGNNWYSLANRFNMNGTKDFIKWTDAYNKEKLNGILVGSSVNPLFANPGKAVLVNPAQLTEFVNYQLPANSPLRTGGVDLEQLFGIKNGGKAFNQNPAPAKGMGACF